MAVSINPELLKKLQQSTCFGIAHDETVPECKMCDVEKQCRAKTEGAEIEVPTGRAVAKATKEKPKEKPKQKEKATQTKKTVASKPKPKSDKPKKPTKPSNSNLPVFKDMELDDLKALAKERNVEWKEYGNDNITRMRLTMELKKSY